MIGVDRACRTRAGDLAEGFAVDSETLAAGLDRVAQGFAIVDAAGRFLFASAPFLDMLCGAGRAGAPADLWAALDALRGDPEANGPPPDPGEIRGQIARQQPASFTFARGSQAIAVAAQPMPGGKTVLSAEDRTAYQICSLRLELASQRDALTGLMNRAAFWSELAEALKQDAPLTVLCLDLDNFKRVNDALGHPTGDRLLLRVAERLRSLTGPGDVLVRLGGDEFALMCPGHDGGEELATRIVELVGRAYLIDGQLVNVGASVGVALAPQHGTDPDTLIKHADLALYRAKGEGKNRARAFEADMVHREQARRQLELDLRKALTLRQFELHYQPQYDVRVGAITGFEALLRWNHPERGRVSPAEFIPLAEEIGAIVPIGTWVVRTACFEAATWPGGQSVAVNLSAVQFRNSNLIQTIAAALALSGLDPARLELEITESVLLQDDGSTLDTLHRLRAMGLRISMDDFGTGYSSLSYLRSFPFDKIKIDQSFVRGLPSEDCAAIVRAIAALGTSLGMAIIAEGVETAAQMERVRLEGCAEMQGYLIGRPMPRAEIGAFLAARQVSSA